MKIERIVMIVLIVFVAFMSTVFIYGFLQKQQKESELKKLENGTLLDNNSTNNQVQNTESSSNTSPALTTQEVSKHNTLNDCYIIIAGQVYNVGAFLDLHPGGADLIVPYCGKDASQAFATQGGRRNGGHSQGASNILKQYLLGPLQK